MRIRFVHNLLFPTTNVGGQSRHLWSLKLIPLFNQKCWKISDEGPQVLPRWLALEEATVPRGCLVLGLDLAETCI